MPANMGFPLPFYADVALSDLPPDPESTAAQAGAMQLASRADHSHPRLTSSHSGLVLDGSGLRTVTFTRSFATKPSVVITPVQAAGTQPVALEIVSYVGVPGAYTGVNVKGYKAQVVLVSILGVNVNTFGGSAAGVEFTLIAVQTS